jgi:hypothetical protein
MMTRREHREGPWGDRPDHDEKEEDEATRDDEDATTGATRGSGMSALEQWDDWLERLRERVGSYKAIAAKLDLRENTVLHWRRRGFPDPAQEARLAVLAGVKLADLQQLLDAARQEVLARTISLERERIARRGTFRAEAPQPGQAIAPTARGSRRAKTPRVDHRRPNKRTLGIVALAGGLLFGAASTTRASSHIFGADYGNTPAMGGTK